jgi:hypothetical protein
MTMYQPGDRIWLRTTGSEMLARLLDPDARSGMVLWLIEVEGDRVRPADATCRS